eukprot:CAMPEP_0201523352 /NCGR_PEP_ID=MMETSP0161_2-20130828/19541_1 /ASSEMBLY_ACC=CAM_ASM_000251 /TAXON_ID=180227 /ORGANISM="Neoparamoeba aestuarina, Strain SoJaBio B1-5/56/2" /LENGTH=113 /DNA_ID=CAMNT_0047922451 /DNA_START=43 /DNA_END=380 /DNA_ORIENTATION=+
MMRWKYNAKRGNNNNNEFDPPKDDKDKAPAPPKEEKPKEENPKPKEEPSRGQPAGRGMMIRANGRNGYQPHSPGCGRASGSGSESGQREMCLVMNGREGSISHEPCLDGDGEG